jgi:hypothetical protein
MGPPRPSAASAWRQRLAASGTRQGLRAVGHHHLHSEMQRPADRAITEQLAGSDQWWVENKVLEHF